jgi:hypothetical protein
MVALLYETVPRQSLTLSSQPARSYPIQRTSARRLLHDPNAERLARACHLTCADTLLLHLPYTRICFADNTSAKPLDCATVEEKGTRNYPIL